MIRLGESFFFNSADVNLPCLTAVTLRFLLISNSLMDDLEFYEPFNSIN